MSLPVGEFGSTPSSQNIHSFGSTPPPPSTLTQPPTTINVPLSDDNETYASSKAALGGKDSVLVEITSISGYYTYVAYTLNAFRIPTKKED